MLKIVPHIGFNDAAYEALRTEDIRFSPSGKMFAIVSKDIIILSHVEMRPEVIRISKTVELYSSGLECAHGVDFVSEEILVIANREGWITFFQMPPIEAWASPMTLPVLHEHQSTWFGPKKAFRESGVRRVRCGPGAVRVNGSRFFVGTNNVNTVTAHEYSIADNSSEPEADILIAQDGLEIPDGLSVSHDGKYLAVSNLHYSKVMIYDLSDNSLLCELMDIDLHCPHGLCFDRTGSILFSADAGNKYIHEFRTSDGWKTSMAEAAYKVQAVDQAAFELTKSETPDILKYLEGGMKGLDMDPTGRVLATTCRHQPLRFFESVSNYYPGALGSPPG